MGARPLGCRVLLVPDGEIAGPGLLFQLGQSVGAGARFSPFGGKRPHAAHLPPRGASVAVHTRLWLLQRIDSSVPYPWNGRRDLVACAPRPVWYPGGHRAVMQ